MTSWPSIFETHRAAIDALRAILADISRNPGRDHPDLKYLADLIPRAPEGKKSEMQDQLPALDFDEMGSEA